MKIHETDEKKVSQKRNSTRPLDIFNDKNVGTIVETDKLGVTFKEGTIDCIEESSMSERFKVDINAKIFLDDERARKMIIGELQAKRMQEEMKKDSSFFLVVNKSPLEIIDDIQGKYAWFLRPICKVRIHISSFANNIITSKTFETISVIVILANSFSLAIEDPTSTETPPAQDAIDKVFLSLYTVEMILKILGMGFILNDHSYLRDGWNLIDFVVVLFGYIQLFMQGSDIKLGGLRTFRVLRPLRSIQRIEGLKRIVQALLSSLPLLGDTLIVLIFFFFIFAIAGLQLFGGILKRRCINEDTGRIHPSEEFYYCGYNECPPSYYCGKTLENPNYNQMNFDTIFYALIAIFTSVTLEGWTAIMIPTMKALSPMTFLFFIPLVFIGAFFLLNLTLAVIKSKFSEEHQKKHALELQLARDMEEMDQDQLDSLKEKQAKMALRKGKRAEDVEFEMLDSQEQQELIAKQGPLQKLVQKKWKTIMFIKQRMRDAIRRYRSKKERKIQLQQMELEKQMSPGRPQTIPEQTVTEENMQTNQAQSTKRSNSVKVEGGNNGTGLIMIQEEETIVAVPAPPEVAINITETAQASPVKSSNNKNTKRLHRLRQSNQSRQQSQEDDSFQEVKIIQSSQKKKKAMRQGQSFSPETKNDPKKLKKEILKDSANSVHIGRPRHKLDNMDHQFFQDFIDEDVQSLSNKYSDNDLIQMARIFKQDFKPEIDGFMKVQKLTPEGTFDKGTSNEAVLQSKERYINDFSLPKINEDTKEHDHTGKKRSDDTSSEPLMINDEQYLEIQMQRSLAAHSAMVVIIESTPLQEEVNDYEERKDAVRELSPSINISNQVNNTSQRPSSRKNMVIGTDENVSLKIKPQRVLHKQMSDQKESLLQNDEMAMAEYQEFQEDLIMQTPNDKGDLPEPVSRPTTAQPQVSNKIVPYDPMTEKQKQEILQFEKTVLNSRYMVEQEIDPTQKLYVRKDKFDFTSTKDVLEDRKMIGKKKFVKRDNEMIQSSLRFESDIKKMTIKPYQKRQFYATKLFLADDEQIQCLNILEMEAHELEQIIQKQYDDAYKSNLYITSTMSICVNKPLQEGLKMRLRRIQDANVQELHKDLFSSSTLNESIINSNRSERNQDSKSARDKEIHPMLKLRRNQANVAGLFKAKDPKVYIRDVQNHLFFKNQSLPQLSRSTKKKTHAYFDITEVLEQHHNMKLLGGLNARSENNKSTPGEDPQSKENERDQKRKQAMLSKQVARDGDLQKKILVTYLNKGALQSRLYRHMYTRRKNMVTAEEMKLKHIAELYGNHLDDEIAKIMQEDAEDDEEEEEEEEDSDDDEQGVVKDDFLDLNIDFEKEIRRAKEDAAMLKKSEYIWSGQDVLPDYDPSSAHLAVKKMSFIRIWPRHIHGFAKYTQVQIKKFIRTRLFDSLMTLFVFLNTLCLGLDRYGMSDFENYLLSLFNQIFTYIFIAEMTLKIIGLGPVKYLRDKINHLDSLVVIISITELIVTLQFSGAHQSFRLVRIFRIFRIIRVGKLLRTFQSMQIIMDVLVKSMNSFIYLALLLLLFLFIFTLLGMQIFGGNLSFDDNFDGPAGVPRANYDTFHSAFLTTFQTLTMEGWHQLFYDALRSDVPRPISALYYISWVFLGNFMLLNLFLAILLDSFTNEELHMTMEEEVDPKKARERHVRQLRKKQGSELIEYYQRSQSGHNHKKSDKKGLGGKKKKQQSQKKTNQNILDESFEYDEKALTKKMTILGKKKVMFEGVACEESLYLFSKENWVRIQMYNLMTHQSFEWVIMALVILSSFKLVIDTYVSGSDENVIISISENFDRFFTGAFAIESIIRAVSLGLIQDQGSYLRETWSQIDFFIVVISIIDASFESINLPVIKILRLFRTLRPLRFISHNSGMKTIVSALVQSIGGIFNVAVVVMIVWMMFAILAVNLFGGKLNYCTVDTYINHTKEECFRNRGVWKIQPFNYDSVPKAMLTLFSLATMENWPNYMYQAISIQGEDLGPKINASPANGYFFVVFILIGSFLFLNLFVGVIFKEFEDAQQEEKASLMLKEKQIKWVDMMKMIVDANPDLETTNKPKQRWRQVVHEFITGSRFKHNYVDIFVMICIILNMFLLAMVFDDSTLVYNNTLDYINYFFTLVFALECVLKLIAFGDTYFNNSWNSFDFFVVCASGIDIVMGQLDTVNLKFLRVGPQLARILRVLRISRLFRLLNKYKGLQALIQTIQFSLPALFNVFALLMLIYFIFSILATFLFRTISEGNIIDDHNNFSNFGMSMLLLIRMSTGEDWNNVMQDTMQTEEDGCIPNKTCGISYAPLFFFPYMMLCTFIMLNLFILVIIQQFETYYLDEDNVISRFKEDIEMFKLTWTHFTKELNCLKIKDTRLVAFMAQMEPPLGMRGEKMTDIIKSVMQMELVSDNEGFVYFNELLYRVMRRVYGDAHVKNKVLIESELVAIEKIQAIKQKMIKKSRGQERLKAAQVNPFMLQLFMNASFKGWHKLAMQNAERRKQEAELGYNQIKMPTQGSLQMGGDRSYAQDDEDEHEELAYETVEDIEIEDSNSFVSEDMMEREYDEEEEEQEEDEGHGQSEHDSQGFLQVKQIEAPLEKGPSFTTKDNVQVWYYPQQPMKVEDEFKEQEKESSSSGQHHLSNVQQFGYKKGSFAEDQTPAAANSSRALIKRGRGESKRAQFRAEWLKKNNKQQHASSSKEQFDDSGEMEF